MREQKRVFFDGNAAAAEAMRLARVQVIAAYPITPQSPIAEGLAGFIEKGTMKAKYMRVESEHSAMSCCIGAALAGARSGTATASVGLALMHEMLGVASGLRLPIVMPVVNRAIPAPWSLWCDHSDAMAERDAGWMQLYAEDSQETLDLTLIAYRAGENPNVLLPTMVNLDAFFVSHTPMVMLLPDQCEVDELIGPYRPNNLKLDPDHPLFINVLTLPDDFTELRYQHKIGFDNAEAALTEAMEEFAKRFGRKHELVEFYRCDDAEDILVTVGSMSGTAAYVVDMLRAKGHKVGVAKIVSFRPFPSRMLRARLAMASRVGVIERAASLGAGGGPVLAEVRSALANLPVPVSGFVAGLGGRDIPPSTFLKVIKLMQTAEPECNPTWVDVAAEAMRIREVVR